MKTDQQQAAAKLRQIGLTSSSAKAWNAGIGTSVGIVILWLLAKWTGAVNMPNVGAITESIMVLAGALVAGAGVLWRTYVVPYLARTAILIAVVAAVPGCAGVGFGDAETPGQQAYRLGGEYVYASIPAAVYVRLPTADRDIVALVCGVEAPAYDSITASMGALEAGGDQVDTMLAAAAAAMADANLLMFDQLSSPDVDLLDDVGRRSVIVAQVLVTAGPPMRAWRSQVVNPALQAMADAQRDPTDAELSAMRDRMVAAHDAIAGACSA